MSVGLKRGRRMADSSAWVNIPAELQQLNNWCIANEHKAPCLMGEQGLYNASPVQGPWHSFEDACRVAKSLGLPIGLIVPEGYTCIDMDIKDVTTIDKVTGVQIAPEQMTTPAELEQFGSIIDMTQSYTELSLSGKGMHCWVRADIGAGRRSGSLEVYSRERFIICTGKPVSAVSYVNAFGVLTPVVTATLALPITDNQLFVEGLVSSLPAAAAKIELVEVEATLTDDEIWRMAALAENKEKFIALCAGQWQELGYPSQSEADTALISMFTFYTKSNEQVRRMFLMTGLGNRDKAKTSYLDRTIRYIRTREAKEAQTDVTIDLQALTESSRIRREAEAEREARNNPMTAAQSAAFVSKIQTQVTESVKIPVDPLPEVIGMDWPPGAMGYLASFIYNSSPRPVKEVAITAALGIIAGMAGKCYHTNTSSGLNLYIILVARSAIGKESMHSGIGLVINEVGPTIEPFINFTDFVSGPALVKACEKTKSFVNVSGEWGRKLKRLAVEDGRDGPMQQLRTVMTNLYQKSGPTSVVGGATYSSDDKNVNSVTGGVAYSMIGETTPGTFYESLTQSMMEDGFLSRFTIIKYDGERPEANRNPVDKMHPNFAQYMKSMSSACAIAVGHKRTQMVPMDEEAEIAFREFDLECDKQIKRAGADEMQRQMWNRAHLKALRTACLLAVFENFTTPMVNKVQAEYALYLMQKDIDVMTTHINGGDIGADDNTRMRKLIRLCRDFLTKPIPISYKISPTLVEQNIIPRKFLHMRTSQVASFTKHRLGATASLDQTIRAAIDSGYITEIDKHKVVADYGFQGRCFKVVNLPD